MAVIARTQGNPSPGHYLTGIIVTPLTVIATGPRDLLNSLDFVYTTPVVLSGGSGNYTVTATLEAPPGVTLSTTKVTVEIETGSVPPPPPTPTPTHRARRRRNPSPSRPFQRGPMCGIIGYTGPRPAAPILLDSLRRLEYRGYDSAGIAIIDAEGDVATVKNTNKVADLARQVEAEGTPSGTVGIGHTRWATHGRPSLENAHPHQDCTGRIHVIHNGIVENYRELRAELMARGHEFLSETDTEVVPHLIEDAFHGDLASAVRSALNRMQGACALVVISADEPDRVVGARMNAPLVVGLGRGEVFVSSDITALIPYTKRIALLGEGEIVTATPDGISCSSWMEPLSKRGSSPSTGRPSRRRRTVIRTSSSRRSTSSPMPFATRCAGGSTISAW